MLQKKPYTDYLDFPSIQMSRLSHGSEVFLKRVDRNFEVHGYHGIVTAVRKPNSFIIDIDVSAYFCNGDFKFRFKPRVVSFRQSKDITIYCIATFDPLKDMAEKRKAYASARNLFKEKRAEGIQHFELLELSPDSSREDFSIIKRRVFGQWHPDKALFTQLSKEDFMAKSKIHLEALAFVDTFIKNRDARLLPN